MGVYIKGIEIPKSCCGCEWRDTEAGGDCELMIQNPFKTYTEQYNHCPFQVILKRYSFVPVPPHGRLIDADELVALVYANIALFDSTPNRLGADQKLVREWLRSMADDINEAPTIIPATE